MRSHIKMTMILALVTTAMGSPVLGQVAGSWWTPLFHEDFESGYVPGQQLLGRAGLGTGVVASPSIPSISTPNTPLYWRAANAGFSGPLVGSAANVHWQQSPAEDPDAYSTFLVTEPLPLGFAATELYFDAAISLRTSGQSQHWLNVWLSTDSGLSFTQVAGVGSTDTISGQTFFVDLTAHTQGSGDFILAFEASGYDTLANLNGFFLDNIHVFGAATVSPLWDNHEPNDTPDMAFDLGGPDGSAILEVSSADNDYFRWLTQDPGTTVVQFNATGDLVAELYKVESLSPLTLRLVDQLGGGTGSRVQHYCPVASEYFLRVTSSGQGVIADVSVIWSGGDDSNIDDAHENNDSIGFAALVGSDSVVVGGLLSWHLDEDWFVIQQSAVATPGPGLPPQVMRVEVEESLPLVRPLSIVLYRSDAGNPPVVVSSSVPISNQVARIDHCPAPVFLVHAGRESMN